MIIDPSSISFSKIREDFLRWLSNRPDMVRWKDFYPSSTGTVFLELMSGAQAFQQYQLTAAKRETYLQYAQARGNVTASAERLGYSVFRGTNATISMAVTGVTVSQSINKYDVVGTVKDQFLYAAENVSLSPGSVTIPVICGTLKTETINIPSEQTFMFRFTNPNVSSHLRLYLNDIEVLYSDSILKTMKGYFAILTNAVNSVDVYSINATRPKAVQATVSNSGGTMSGATQQYAYRITAVRGITDVAGTESLASDEVTVTINNGLSTNSVKLMWSYPGADYYKIYKGVSDGNGGYTYNNYWISYTTSYTDTVTGTTGTTAGTFPTSNPYFYTTADRLKIQYIELKNFTFSASDLRCYYGNVNVGGTTITPYNDMESIDNIKVNAPLHHESQYVVRGRVDYMKLFKSLAAEDQGIFLHSTSYHNVSSAVVELTYVTEDQTLLNGTQKTNILTRISGENARPMGLEPPTIVDPTGNGIKLRIAVVMSDATVTDATLQAAITTILAAYSRHLNISFTTRDIENDLEALSYIKVARVIVDTLEFRTRANNTTYVEGQRVKFAAGNMAGFYAYCTAPGVSGNSEPQVNNPSIGKVVVDNLCTWRVEKLNEVTWQAGKSYIANEVVIPSITNGLYYKALFVEAGDTGNRLSGYDEITGVNLSNTSSAGLLYFSITGASPYTINIYKDAGLTLLVGHTAAYTTIGAQAIVADNSSGLGGYITVDSLGTGSPTADMIGTSGTTEPTWPTVIGNTVMDSGVTWQCVQNINPSNITFGWDEYLKGLAASTDPKVITYTVTRQ